MPASPPTVVAYSAEVRLALEVNGATFELADAGPGDAVLRTPSALPAGPARVVVTIDGRRTVRRIVVTGQSADGLLVKYESEAMTTKES
jgi:hypothetical protein